MDPIRFVWPLDILRQIVKPDLSQIQDRIVYPADRLAVAIQTMTAKYLFDLDI